MKFTEKMILLTEAKYKKLMEKKPMEIQQMRTMENPEMRTMYSPQCQVLPFLEPTEGSEKTMEGMGEELSKDIILSAMPKSYKSRAANLLNHIDHSKVLGWNENGELVYNSKLIPHSQIVDLVRDALWEQKFKPIGSEEFYRGLHQSNVPLALIGNHKRQQELLVPSSNSSEVSSPPNNETEQRRKWNNPKSRSRPEAKTSRPPGIPKSSKPKLNWVKF